MFNRTRCWRACAALITSLLFVSAAKSIEEPAFTLLDSFDRVEIRRYAPSVQASTAMRGDNDGFRTLARYIFGGNAGEQKIEMTAPVTTTIGGDTRAMAFTMPSDWSVDTLPAPDDERVELHAVPGFTAAVIRFSGRATAKRVADELATLLQSLEARGVAALGAPLLNRYDPPWTLPFLRRNEIMLRVGWPGADDQT